MEILWLLLISTCIIAHCFARFDDAMVQDMLEIQVKSAPELPASLKRTILIQNVNEEKSKTSYSFDGDKSVAYVRNGDDSDKEVVVLKSVEDKIVYKYLKRVYIVLQNINGTSTYNGRVAIFRDNNPKDVNPVKINGSNYQIEWTIFDEHFSHAPHLSGYIGLICGFSVITPCSLNESALIPAEKFIPSPPFVFKSMSKKLSSDLEKMKWKTENGEDSNKNYDFYLDIDDSVGNEKVLKQGRGLLESAVAGLAGGLKFAADAVGSVASSVVCTVTSIGCAAAGVVGAKVHLASEVMKGVGGVMVAVGRKKRDTPAKVIPDKSVNYPGWKTQYVKSTPISYLSRDVPDFYGFGNCPYKPVSTDEFKELTLAEDVIDFYMKLLRTDCIDYMKPLLKLILDSEVITFTNLRFEYNPNHKFLAKQILPLKDLMVLTAASELAAFTNAYAYHQSTKLQKFRLLDENKEVSGSIDIIVTMGLIHLKTVRELVRPHMIHLSRHLLHTVQAILVKLQEDRQNLGRCEKHCEKDLERNYVDQLYIMGLLQFIMRGLGPVDSGAVGVEQGFYHFFKNNENSIVRYVNSTL